MPSCPLIPMPMCASVLLGRLVGGGEGEGEVRRGG